MKKSSDGKITEIKSHTQKAADLFAEGQAIHKAYMQSPEDHNISEEVEQFSEKLNKGLTELDEANKIKNELIKNTKLTQP